MHKLFFDSNTVVHEDLMEAECVAIFLSKTLNRLRVGELSVDILILFFLCYETGAPLDSIVPAVNASRL